MSGKRSWVEHWARIWNARGKNGARLLRGAVSKLKAPPETLSPYVYAVRRQAGYPAARAFEAAVNRNRMGDLPWEFEWISGGESLDQDFPHNANVLNRCEHEHNGRHVRSRGDSGHKGGRGHYDGELSGVCCYARNSYDVSRCVLWERCEDCEDRVERRDGCKHCKVLASIGGVEESNDNRERDSYRMLLEDELLAEALGEADQESELARQYAVMC